MPDMTPADIHTVALCIWREARGEGLPGMTGVAAVIRNRGLRHKMSPASVVGLKWAFSSMTDPHDPQLSVYPGVNDVQFGECQKLAQGMDSVPYIDVTNGATLYHDTSIGFPSSWNPKACRFTCQIGRLLFYREL